LFFEYFIQKLRKQHKIVSTTRKYEQVNGIRKFGSISPIIIGNHGGKNKVDKLLASLKRSKLLTEKIEKNKPDLLISFCSPEASRVAFGLGIPHISFSDSPHAKAVMKLSLPYVTKLLTPWVIPKKDFQEFGINSRDIIQYRAIDAGVIIKNYKKSKQKKLRTQKVILIRPEESEAAYIDKKSKTAKIIKKIVKKFPDEKKIVVTRYKDQSDEIRRDFGKNINILSKPVSGRELLSNVDCFVGSGGTMTAEAGLLGIPTISIWHARTPRCFFSNPLKPIRSSRQHGQCGLPGFIQSSTIPELSISTPFRIDGSTIDFPCGSFRFLRVLATIL